MKIELKKKPQNPIIIEGFPGFGLIGTIVTEFLLEHMNCEMIGEFVYDDLPAMVAIHKGKLIKPMAVHYSKKYNIIILQTILNPKGKEWDIANAILDMARQLKAKKIISAEGVASPPVPSKDNDQTLFYYGDDKLKHLGLKPIDESIVVGVTAGIMLNFKNHVCIFSETKSALPDSKSAANIIKILDKYLGLKVDYKPLLKQAADFEDKLKSLISQTSKTEQESDKKYMSYLG
ncbi:MAG: PAC2 family protein [Nanoarchaeota archaeon]|nr:PAC2 family protein [Nanoarchaeota archaeon]